MGVDIYLGWKGMTQKDKSLQYTGFDVCSGKYGYLRGAYNGHIGYDSICILFDGVDWEKDWKVEIKLLKRNLKRLENGLFISSRNKFYRDAGKDLEIQSYFDFVSLAEKLFREGKEPFVEFSY